ncbi:hypothetical protein EXA21_06665 [Vibrio cincinnatiensis]|uniref:hypothetical protein n=1 Tax=Vibrio cincinnatiensis TaxID=675 RepID=UPI001EDF2803|nr:hypothetical protein [Vibrio cincinnatiensis]MCG3758973.1 hypothetical protein [Vibrio cincinnatiensis]MCG3762586.1 hypothetical protein [Vibrio cincinnatiensis]
MKKVGIVTLILGISGYAYAQSELNVKAGMAMDQQLSVVLEANDQYRFIVGNDGAAFDYLAKRGSFARADIPFDWYVGVGVWAEWDDDFGVRVPLGIDWPVNAKFNLYGQVHPELNMYSGTELQLGGAVGAIYRF